MTLHVNEFLPRFLLHVLPSGFVRIRHFGFLSTRNRSKQLTVCFRVLQAMTDSKDASANTPATVVNADHPEHSRVVWLCPHCHGEMVILERLTAFDLRFRGPPDPSNNRGMTSHLIVGASRTFETPRRVQASYAPAPMPALSALSLFLLRSSVLLFCLSAAVFVPWSIEKPYSGPFVPASFKSPCLKRFGPVASSTPSWCILPNRSR
jgi:hypothetical protein